MLSFSQFAFEEACRKSTDVNNEVLRRAIDWISTQFIIDIQEQGRGVKKFNAYFNECLHEFDIADEDTRAYQTALGVYFNLQRQRRSWGNMPVSAMPKISPLPANPVEEVTHNSVRIRATREVSITFGTKVTGNLKWDDVHEQSRIEHVQFPIPTVNDRAYDKAKKQALAILNSRRKKGS